MALLAVPKNDFSTMLERAADTLHTELWTSWASMLRVYAAAHGLNSSHGAVVEVGAEEIVLRVDTRWVRFTRDSMSTSEGGAERFSIDEDGRVRIGGTIDEMDMVAERVTREAMLDVSKNSTLGSAARE